MSKFSTYIGNIFYLAIFAFAAYVLFSQYKLNTHSKAPNQSGNASYIASAINEAELRSAMNDALILEKELDSSSGLSSPQLVKVQTPNVTEPLTKEERSVREFFGEPTENSKVSAAVPNQAVDVSAPKKVAELMPVNTKKISQEDEVLLQLASWRSAWQDQDVARYLASYSRKMSHKNGNFNVWASQRRSRISKPKWIRVEINEPKVSISNQGKSARVVFQQVYRASNYSDISDKELIMEKEGINWNITQENIL